MAAPVEAYDTFDRRFALFLKGSTPADVAAQCHFVVCVGQQKTH